MRDEGQGAGDTARVGRGPPGLVHDDAVPAKASLEATRHPGTMSTPQGRAVYVVAPVRIPARVIGFVGLFVPHGVRLVFGPDHRLLMPASFLSGAAFLCLADALGRVLARPGEMPVGLITAVVGAPCFLVLLLRARVPGRGMP